MAARAERFEDLIAWQKARELRRAVIHKINAGTFRQDWDLISQLRRACTSVMANIAEGFDRTGPREFCRFLSTAKGSCGEVRSHLYAAFDSGYLDEAELDRLRSIAEETGRVIAGLRAAIKRNAARDET